MLNKISGNKGKDLKCPICEAPFTAKSWQQKYCSDQCRSEAWLVRRIQVGIEEQIAFRIESGEIHLAEHCPDKLRKEG